MVPLASRDNVHLIRSWTLARSCRAGPNLTSQTANAVGGHQLTLTIHPPALAAVGLTPDRVVYVHARKPKIVLLVMEEGLRHRGLAGVVAEFSGALGLTASRRLQLGAEQSGVTAFLLRRSRCFDNPILLEPSAAVTRWRVATVPSGPPLPHVPETPGLGRPRWRVDLIRCRGGEAHSWIVEAFDATGRCRLVADLADRPVAAEPRRAVA